MRPLVFVHGFMGGGAQWQDQQALSEVRDLICLDLPGFGTRASESALPSIEAYGAWALAELNRLGISTFDLLGHSMGGMIVQAMIAQEPERVHKLILYGTGAQGLLPGRFEPIETSMQRAKDEGAEATAKRISATWFLDWEKAPTYSACAQIACQSQLTAIIQGLAAMRDWSGVAALAKIKSPTLVLWGDKDRTYDWAQTQRLWTTIKEANLAVVPGCAHAVHMEKPGLFNDLVRSFLIA